MRINDTEFNASLHEILDELVSQLRANDIQYIQKRIDTSKDIQICCPYHNGGMERKPSAGIRKSDGLFHCFACNEVHSLPEVISYCFGHENDLVGAFGWRWLVRNFSTVEVEERKDVELDLERNKANRKHRSLIIDNNRSSAIDIDNDRDDQEYVTEEELDSYRYIHPYMYKRKLTDEIIELFDIGYDATTESITFPVKDIGGNCLFVARRSVKTKWFNYPQGVEKPLYGLYEYTKVSSEISKGVMMMRLPPRLLDTLNEVIVCESMLDALTCWVYGRYAVALNGLGNELQFKQLRQLPCRKLILATDADERGMAARQRIRKNIQNRKLITEYVWDKQEAKDINDMTESQFNRLQEVF